MKDELLKGSKSIPAIWFFLLDTKTFPDDFPQDFRVITFQTSRNWLYKLLPLFFFRFCWESLHRSNPWVWPIKTKGDSKETNENSKWNNKTSRSTGKRKRPQFDFRFSLCIWLVERVAWVVKTNHKGANWSNCNAIPKYFKHMIENFLNYVGIINQNRLWIPFAPW